MLPLLRALSDSDKETRVHAAMELGDLRSRAAVEPLSKLLSDRALAETAARSLVEIADERALPSLRQAASVAGSRWQRRMFDVAVSDLERRVGLIAVE